MAPENKMVGKMQISWNNVVFLIDDDIFVDEIDLIGLGDNEDDVIDEIYDMYTDLCVVFTEKSKQVEDFIESYLAVHDSLADQLGVHFTCGEAYAKNNEGDPRGNKAFTRTNL